MAEQGQDDGRPLLASPSIVSLDNHVELAGMQNQFDAAPKEQVRGEIEAETSLSVQDRRMANSSTLPSSGDQPVSPPPGKKSSGFSFSSFFKARSLISNPRAADNSDGPASTLSSDSSVACGANAGASPDTETPSGVDTADRAAVELKQSEQPENGGQADIDASATQLLLSENSPSGENEADTAAVNLPQDGRRASSALLSDAIHRWEIKHTDKAHMLEKAKRQGSIPSLAEAVQTEPAAGDQPVSTPSRKKSSSFSFSSFFKARSLSSIPLAADNSDAPASTLSSDSFVACGANPGAPPDTETPSDIKTADQAAVEAKQSKQPEDGGKADIGESVTQPLLSESSPSGENEAETAAIILPQDQRRASSSLLSDAIHRWELKHTDKARTLERAKRQGSILSLKEAADGESGESWEKERSSERRRFSIVDRLRSRSLSSVPAAAQTETLTMAAAADGLAASTPNIAGADAEAASRTDADPANVDPKPPEKVRGKAKRRSTLSTLRNLLRIQVGEAGASQTKAASGKDHQGTKNRHTRSYYTMARLDGEAPFDGEFSAAFLDEASCAKNYSRKASYEEEDRMSLSSLHPTARRLPRLFAYHSPLIFVISQSKTLLGEYITVVKDILG